MAKSLVEDRRCALESFSKTPRKYIQGTRQILGMPIHGVDGGSAEERSDRGD